MGSLSSQEPTSLSWRVTIGVRFVNWKNRNKTKGNDLTTPHSITLHFWFLHGWICSICHNLLFPNPQKCKCNFVISLEWRPKKRAVYKRGEVKTHFPLINLYLVSFISFSLTFLYYRYSCIFSRKRMWWQSLALLTTVTDVGIWLPYWKSGKTWSRISFSLIQHLDKLSQTLRARLQIIFCDLSKHQSAVSNCCLPSFQRRCVLREKFLLFEGFIVNVIILSVGVCPAAADFDYVLKGTRDLIEGAVSLFLFSLVYFSRGGSSNNVVYCVPVISQFKVEIRFWPRGRCMGLVSYTLQPTVFIVSVIEISMFLILL